MVLCHIQVVSFYKGIMKEYGNLNLYTYVDLETRINRLVLLLLRTPSLRRHCLKLQDHRAHSPRPPHRRNLHTRPGKRQSVLQHALRPHSLSHLHVLVRPLCHLQLHISRLPGSGEAGDPQ